MKSIKSYILESNTISVDISKWNINDIPEDSSIDIENVKGYSGINFSLYKYFGDCKNTVDKDKMWDATQMSNWIKKCGLISVENVLGKLNNGDRKIPAKFNKIVNTLKANNKLNDLSEICCGMDNYQKMMFIYLTETDTHYFFDCKR